MYICDISIRCLKNGTVMSSRYLNQEFKYKILMLNVTQQHRHDYTFDSHTIITKREFCAF